MLKIKITDISDEIWIESWSNYNPTLSVHEQEITIPAETTGSDLAGTYFSFYDIGNENKYIGWFDIDSEEPSLLFTTNVQITILEEDTNSDIATKVASAINALDNFSASATDNVVTVTTASEGWCTLGQAETSNLVFETTTQGSAGPVPETIAGDWVIINGKIKDDTLINNEEHPDKYKQLSLIVAAENITSIQETNN